MGEQRRPSVAAFQDGGFVVVWEQYWMYEYGFCLFGRRFAPDGSETVPEFGIFDCPQPLPTSVWADSPDAVKRAASTSDGGFVAAWSAQGENSSEENIFFQRFDSESKRVGLPVQANSLVGEVHLNATIVAVEGGGWVTVWDRRTDTSEFEGDINEMRRSVFFRLWNDEGDPVGLESEPGVVSDDLYWEKSSSAAPLSGGGFVVVWERRLKPFGNSDVEPEGATVGLFARVFDSQGIAATEEVVLTSGLSGLPYVPRVASLAAGGFVVSWMSSNAGLADPFDVFARVFGQDGVPYDTEFRVDTSPEGAQKSGVVAGLADGGFVVLWLDSTADDSCVVCPAILGRLYSAAGNGQSERFSVNSFTLGRQGGASVASLSPGGFVAVWHSWQVPEWPPELAQDGDGMGVFGQRFDKEANKLYE